MILSWNSQPCLGQPVFTWMTTVTKWDYMKYSTLMNWYRWSNLRSGALGNWFPLVNGVLFCYLIFLDPSDPSEVCLRLSFWYLGSFVMCRQAGRTCKASLRLHNGVISFLLGMAITHRRCDFWMIVLFIFLDAGQAVRRAFDVSAVGSWQLWLLIWWWKTKLW